MDRNQLTLVIALVLFAAFLLGWILRWGYGGMNKINASGLAEIDALATKLHETEVLKDEATRGLHQKEIEMKNKLSQSSAELEAAMQGLGEARREVDFLRGEIEAALEGR